MKILSLTSFVLIILCPAWSSAAFGDPCEIVTVSNLSGSHDQVVNITVPKDCLFGDVDWNYPKGSLLLSHSTGGKNFQLCIEKGWGTFVTQVQEIVNGIAKTLALPTEETPTCTKSTNSEAALLISSPSAQMYMTMFNYRIIPEK
ncbi:hypothetical protein Bpfe_006327 [Biomphalaria pfeifferi]|uniref:Uncharacterized protein n=1 Tax=Biomphalaria pfeifferi TaxID=112525 RepID=A0AAD8FGG8_BIOPF|nr:hypothetical protein Bpfe_006327 [Biomphalaria pfeifferi]